MLDAGLAKINAGTGDATGDFHLMTSGDAALATLPFNATAFAAATDVSGTATAVSNAISGSGSATAGTIAKGAFRDKANLNLFTFSIGTSGADMNFASVTIPSGTAQVTSSGVQVTLTIAA
jgi:hypothetical protein